MSPRTSSESISTHGSPRCRQPRTADRIERRAGTAWCSPSTTGSPTSTATWPLLRERHRRSLTSPPHTWGADGVGELDGQGSARAGDGWAQAREWWSPPVRQQPHAPMCGGALTVDIWTVTAAIEDHLGHPSTSPIRGACPCPTSSGSHNAVPQLSTGLLGRNDRLDRNGCVASPSGRARSRSLWPSWSVTYVPSEPTRASSARRSHSFAVCPAESQPAASSA